ncbi:MAG: hypothetical protein QXJ52_06290 [Candidatus Korarchaeota archaeon]|nr:hypothetical protein [Thermoproteota archaeon]
MSFQTLRTELKKLADQEAKYMHAMNIPTAIMKASTALAIGLHTAPQSHAKKPL